MNKLKLTTAPVVATFAPVAAMAQDTIDTVTAVAAQVTDAVTQVPAGDPLGGTFASVAGLAAAILPVTGWLKTHVLKTIPTQGLSWAVAAALAAIGYVFDLGVFATAGPAWTAILAVAAGLIANGTANVHVVKIGLMLIGAKVKKTA